MKATRTLLLSSLLAMLLPAAAWAVDVRLAADATIDSLNAAVNFGSDGNLKAGGGAYALIQFDLSTLPGGITEDDIGKATLLLYANGPVAFNVPATPVSLSIFPVTSAWVESSVTFNTAPTTALALTSVTVTPTGFVQVDITAMVKHWVTTPASNFGIELVGSSNITFDSKENLLTSHSAMLDITLGGPLLVRSPGLFNTAMGNGALASNTSGTGNTASGANALHNNTTGLADTATGAGALGANTTGLSNTAMGTVALATNTAGSFNTAVGHAALAANTTASGNTAVGFDALGANTTGPSNTAVGKHALVNNTFGASNTAVGYEALFFNSGGTGNTAVGFSALVGSPLFTTGFNTAVGQYALYANNASHNTAVGSDALRHNTTGFFNTAVGTQALVNNTAGASNTAVGSGALFFNSIGTGNTAVGSDALGGSPVPTTGNNNTALGMDALRLNNTGNNNTGLGNSALISNANGNNNTALGHNALSANTNGNNNTALGHNALNSNTTGNRNLAIGFAAGQNLTTGDHNIDIVHTGVAGESGTMRIGGVNQTRTFIAGIRGVQTGLANGVTVLIDSNGQLGTISSSRRYKQEIRDMGEASSALMRLRPVTFRYKQPSEDGSRPLEYGLIAEEVADIYPDLVTHTPDGAPETVQYHKINAMLLNEVQKLSARVAALEELLRSTAPSSSGAATRDE
jgi:hypothetical protein